MEMGVNESIPKSTGNCNKEIRDRCLLYDTCGVFQRHEGEVVMPTPVSFLPSQLRQRWCQTWEISLF
jgi:hypothetical protein